MRQRRVPAVITILAVIVAAVAALVAPSAPVGAAGLPGIGLPLEFARDVVVDPGTGRLFVSGDDAVVVRKPDGSALKTITGIPDALDLVAAGGNVYAVSATGSRIVRIDPVGLTVTRTYTIPAAALLRGVALHDDRLWTVAVGPNAKTLVSIPATGSGQAVLFPDLDLGDGPVIQLLSTPSLLIVASSGAVAALDHADDEVTVVAASEEDELLTSAALGPDGTSLVTGYRTPGGVRERSLPSLAVTTQHPVDAAVAALATTPVGGGLIASTGGRAIEPRYQPDTHVFRPGTPAPVAKAQADRGDDRDAIVGAATWSADGTTLWGLRDDGPYDSPKAPSLVPITIVPVGVSAFPRVVAPSGASTTLTGQGLTGGTVEVDGEPATITWFRPTTVTIDLPELDLGPATATVDGLTGATASTGLVVRDLGPFTSSAHLVEQVEDGFYPGIGVNEAWLASEDQRLAGGGSIGALAADITRSNTWIGHRNPAARLYFAALDRPADPEGLHYWWSQLSGRSLISVAAYFARSAEFRAEYGSLDDAAFVERIYQNVLGRQPDATGGAYWRRRLAEGLSRGAVLAHFSESKEHRVLTASEVDVTFLYVALLQRSPRADELTTVSERLEEGSSLATEAETIIRSAEYATVIDPA